MTTFLDTNVLIYLLNTESPLHGWAVSEFDGCRARGPTIISDIVYSEFSVAMNSREETDTAISQLSLERVRGTADALFQAGKAFRKYRSQGGKRTRILPDFIIGAIAVAAGGALMTANPDDFSDYFPNIKIISPDGERGTT